MDSLHCGDDVGGAASRRFDHRSNPLRPIKDAALFAQRDEFAVPLGRPIQGQQDLAQVSVQQGCSMKRESLANAA